jgi:GDPmannose 4,6-dehydratase
VSQRTALITGIAGQDGTYLAEHLLAEGAEVIGVDRGGSATDRLQALGLFDRVRLDSFDICDPAAIRKALVEHGPTEVYHLASVSFVPESWQHPVAATSVGVLPTAAFLDAILAEAPGTRLVQAASSEIFGRAREAPQDESTPLDPATPYGATKAFCVSMGRMYRERMGAHVSSAILYNHESPRRPERFVTRKITRAAAAISLGLQSELSLGNLDTERDWSFAGDIVRGMAQMAVADSADDYVLATGRTHTVRDLLDVAFGVVDVDWTKHVRVDPAFVRPNEPHRLCGDASKARNRLGWKPEVEFPALVRMMVEADLVELQR